MKPTLFYILVVSLASITLSSYNSSSGVGVSHDEVIIGAQVWMKKNLNAEKFRNGDPIYHAQTFEEWQKAGKNGQPAWCYYENDLSNGEKYGKLYNWYAVNDPRGLAPKGWRIPSDSDWVKLTNFLYNRETEDMEKQLKSKQGWKDEGNGNNKTGFSALPSGSRGDNFYAIGQYGYWWSSTERDQNSVWLRIISHKDCCLDRESGFKNEGFSVRCVRDY